MWFDPPPKRQTWAAARRHLRASHPSFETILKRIGPCTLAPRRDYFVVLCKSIFNQQISTKIAAILFGRFRDLFPQRRPTPAKVLEKLRPGSKRCLSDDEIRAVGISRQKRKYLVDLAEHFISGAIPTRRFAAMNDEEIIESLTRVNGIGRWTAEMFLMFVLNRPDVWPIDDLGLREAARQFWNLPARPSAKDLTQLGERFRPWRSIATWYLWRSLGQ